MINLIMGRPGGGKSFEAVVYHLIPAIQSGRKVVTNLPINIDAIKNVYGVNSANLVELVSTNLHDYDNNNRPFSTAKQFENDWRSDDGKGVLFIVDEAHMVMGRNANNDLLEYLSMHRHFGVDIILITQSDRKLHKDIRDMIEIVYRCIKNTALGSSKTYTKKVMMGLRGDVVNTEQRKYIKSYFKFYQSHTGTNKAVQESLASDIRPFWKSKSVIFLFIFVLLAVAGLINFAATDTVLSGNKKTPIAMSDPINSKVTNNNLSVHQNVVTSLFSSNPLSNDLSVVGYSEYVVNNSGAPFHKFIYYLNYVVGKRIIELSSDDLFDMGFDLVRLNDCSFNLYKNNDLIAPIFCNYPKPEFENVKSETVGGVLKDSFGKT